MGQVAFVCGVGWYRGIMCCVLGYVGNAHCRMNILEGLTRLEYRGYDSAGYACYDARERVLASCKVVGGVAQLMKRAEALPAMDEFIGVGHTRWATNGVVTEENAHPVFDCTKTCAVVHNGIIENEHALRVRLHASGHTFCSQTDTELIAHLVEECVAMGIVDARGVLKELVHHLQGAYACIILANQWPDTLLAIRRRSPLCIVRGCDGFFVASDPLACAGRAQFVTFLPDESYALVNKNSYEIYRHDGARIDLAEERLDLEWECSGKQGYEHYMLKEIYEQRAVIKSVVTKVAPLVRTWLARPQGAAYAQAPDVLFTACGTSYYAAQIARYYREMIVGLPGKAVVASEVRDWPLLMHKDTWVCALSQSGETADTLEALRYLQGQGMPVVAVTNRPTSTMAREATYSIPMHAGNEIAVASSKTLAAHVGIFYLLAHACARLRCGYSADYYDAACDRLMHTADIMQEAISRNITVIDTVVAPELAQRAVALTVGRGSSFFVAQELALKLKELAYIFVEAHLAGELKHGPLALIEPGVTVMVCSTLEERPYQKLLSTVHEICAREGRVVALAFEGQHELGLAAHTTLWIPRPRDPLLGPLVMLGVVQYLAYRVAYELGRPIDKPRNLAKSVTVE